MKTDKTIKLITRHMDRVQELTEALPTWVAVPEIDEIVIVNWGVTDDLTPLATDSRITIINVPDQEYFDPGAAWNVGCRYADDADFLALLDCDIKIFQSAINKVDVISSDTFYRPHITNMGTIGGSSIIPTKAFIDANGFKEKFTRYGFEDQNFYNRLLFDVKYKEKKCFMSTDMLHIDHLRELCTRHLPPTASAPAEMQILDNCTVIKNGVSTVMSI